MTQQTPNNATPEDIEAALQTLRSSVDAPPPPPSDDPPPLKRRRRTNWSRLMALMVVAAVAGAIGVLFIPGLNQRQTGADNLARGRIAELETRLDRLTTELAPDNARQALRETAARLDALAARMDALEKRPADTVSVPLSRVVALEAQVAAIRTALAALESRVSGVPASPPSIPAAPPSVEPNQPTAPVEAVPDELAALDRRIGAIEDSLPAPETFAEFDRRLTELEGAEPAVSQRNAALALIVARLSQAVADGRPFALELAALQGAAPGLIDVATLQPYADRGLPPVSVLAARLEALDGDIRSAADEDRGGDWTDRLWRGLTGLVVVRTDGEVEGNEPEDRLERAIWRARAGDLRAAANEIGTLTGRAGEAASVWLGDARARLTVEDALGAASNAILQDLARPGQ